MPDPVGERIAVLLDRIDFLEARLAHMQQRVDGAASENPGNDRGNRSTEQ